MQVIAFNKARQAQYSVNVSDAKEAAKLAVNLVAANPFVRVQDGDYKLVISQHMGVNAKRLAHIIEHKATL